MNTELKPLVKAKTMIEDVQLEMTYEYDDLVFVQHNPFLLRFDQVDPSKIYLHFNVDCELPAADSLEKVLKASAEAQGLNLILDSKYAMTSDEETDEIKIAFEQN